MKLLMFLVVMGLPALVRAQFTFTTNNGSLTITGYTGSGGSVAIPATINGIPVANIGSGAFAGTFLHPNTTLTSVIIPNSVSTIQDEAFYTCTALTNAVISCGVIIIGPYAFNQCSALNGLVIPDSVTTIGSFAFLGCVGLTGSLTMPDSVISIGEDAFAGCPGLTTVFFRGNAPATEPNIFAGDNATVYYLPGTTGWSQMFDGFPTEQWNPQIQTGDNSFGVESNQFGFNITGTSNLTVLVEACTNLSYPNWSPVSTNTLNTPSGTNGTSYFSDPMWTTCAERFYRLSSP